MLYLAEYVFFLDIYCVYLIYRRDLNHCCRNISWLPYTNSGFKLIMLLFVLRNRGLTNTHLKSIVSRKGCFRCRQPSLIYCQKNRIWGPHAGYIRWRSLCNPSIPRQPVCPDVGRCRMRSGSVLRMRRWMFPLRVICRFVAKNHWPSTLLRRWIPRKYTALLTKVNISTHV